MRVGLEVLLTDRAEAVRGRRVGIVSNPNGVLPSFESIVSVLPRAGAKVVALFGPEHGLAGAAQAGEHVGAAHDPQLGIPIYSLYGETRKPTQAMLTGIDTLVFDMQDAGARFYTYIFTMARCMEAAREHGLAMVVLDRPNPLGGLAVEGPVVQPELDSFVGAYGLPVRYGLTIGELAHLFNTVGGIGCDLTVIPLDGWRRSWWYEATGLPWILPSPNLPTVDSCFAFAATCPIEGTNVSEGRGTTRPFELVGAPFIDADQLAQALRGFALPGVAFRPCRFTPTFSKWQGETCHGIQLYVTDRGTYAPARTGVALLLALRHLYLEQLHWRDEGRTVDRLTGDTRIRVSIDHEEPLEAIEAAWQPGLERFRQVRRELLGGRRGGRSLASITPASELIRTGGGAEPWRALRNELRHIALTAGGRWGIAFRDLSSGDGFSINGETVFPGASASKVPLLLEVLRRVDSGQLRLEEPVTVSVEGGEDTRLGSGILIHLRHPITVTLHDLCELAINLSDNVASNELIDRVGFAAVNSSLTAWGCERMRLTHHFRDFAALREPDHNPVVPDEMAHILTRLWQREFALSDAALGYLSRCSGTTRLPLHLPDSARVYHKTGTLRGIVHDAGIIESPFGTYVLVCFSDGGEDNLVAGQAIARMSQAVWHAVSR
ncbi:MAG: DUF1343 domain-containing protein [Chloroflexi bacterium]|nr:DUF1343 domain-containing protein [Chloroflexota bacterium]